MMTVCDGGHMIIPLLLNGLWDGTQQSEEPDKE